MIRYVVLVFALISFVPSKGQNIKFEHYNDKDGLSHNSVRRIVQDENGFLWLGTFSGLNRFDGYQFKSFMSTSGEDNTMNNDDITVLLHDDKTNNLWIGTRKGLTLLDRKTGLFTTYLPDHNNPYSLPDEEIRSIYVDKFGRVWVGTKSKGVYMFFPEEERFSKINIEGFNYIKEIVEDKNGTIWVGSYDTGSVARIKLNDRGEIEHLKRYTLTIPNSEKINPYLNFIYEDHKSDIFVGTREGLYKRNKNTDNFENLYIDNEVVRNKLGPYFLSVARAPDDKYWVGTLGGLLVCDSLEEIKTGNYEWHYSVLSDDTSLVDNLVSALYFDASGVLWIGTEEGLDKYDPFQNQFKLNKGISSFIDNQAPRIRGFSKTFDNKLIVATRNNGLFILKDNDVAPLFNDNKDIASIFSYDGKTFYCGLWDGKVLVYDYVRNSSRIVDVGFQSSPIFDFEKYKDNFLIISSFGEGAVCLDIESLGIIGDIGKLLLGYQINKVVADTKGNLWFATEGGIAKYGPDFKLNKLFQAQVNSGYGLPHNNVSDITIDFSGNVLAATRMGLAEYDPNLDDFRPVEEPKELKGKWITEMTLDSNGYLWLNMNNGIAKYDVPNKTAHIYQVNSGNRLDVFSSSGFYNFDSSKIYLGGKNGIIHFSPLQIAENNWSPPPVITEFKIQNKEITPGLQINGQVPFQEELNSVKSVELDYVNRNFSVQFSSPSFTNQRLNKYQYMLQGFDDDWIETNSDSRTVQYTNLYSGDYVFKIRSSNNDGKWSTVSEYKIRIHPPFWLSYKGIFIILALLSMMIYLLRRQLKLRLKLKQELLLEKVKRERDEKLNNEKLRFFTNISHELRTPLTLILGPVKQLLEQESINSYSKSRVDLIHQNANRLLRLVNQILDFRRAETGELKLKVAKTDLLTTTNDIFNSFHELAQSKNISFNLNVEDVPQECLIDVDKYSKILYNLLSNAMKFTNVGGNVDLYLGVSEGDDKNLILEVSDDGIGIPVESKEKIFSRFYQAKNSKENTTGTGIGLSLVKALVEIHKGTINVESKPDSGSIFTVKLPIYDKAYTKEEKFNPIPVKQVGNKVQPMKPLITGFSPSDSVKKVKTNTNIKEKILIIDDNPELRKYIAEYLSDYYKVYEAENGKEGLELCSKVKPVLCVADVMMPVMDGFEFVETLKSDDNISHIAVVLLTALAENENRIRGYKIGVDGYLVKPFDPALLKTRIDNIIKIHSDLKRKFSGDLESDVISLAHSEIDIELISNIKDIVESNIGNPEFTSSMLCSELAMSSSKLYRKITQLTDMSPNEFIRTIRLKKSATLLKTKNYNVSEVANMVGFNDPLYFSRCFKKQFGHSPSQLIK
ncbi:hybrid sensor histidine kinase/response regulator [Maribacter luteus]|uniref:hybrid sensor histidine kinase/response regulator n=1 Tax=Maribacter luteus TaxID=2594478 RepID=UPI00248FC8DC|nr:two-component regulator propeller domain-containing protein [Maribacter luteus]